MNKMFCFLISLIFIIMIISCDTQTNQNNDNAGDVASIPISPDSLSLMDSSDTAVKLRWNDNSNNESNFVIQRSMDNSFTNPADIIVPANSQTWTDTGLSQNTAYYYRIYAQNRAGNSSISDNVSATTETSFSVPAGSRVADHNVINFIRKGLISVNDIQNAKTDLHIAYGHTSHGSQLANGMEYLVGFANGSGCNGAYSSNQDLFGFDYDGTNVNLHLLEGSMAADCGYYSTNLTITQYFEAKDNNNDPDPNWEYETRYFLGTPDANGHGSKNPDYNVIIWSWCGQAAWYGEDDINNYYLNPMNQLEADYPGIIFVYMTCHLNGTGPTGILNLRNQQIRDFCNSHNKWLFDFADIETYDPDGICYENYIPTDGCIYDFNGNGNIERVDYDEVTPVNGDRNWAADWQNTHTVDVDWFYSESAHSMPLNANMKAYAAWWLWCRLAGWGN